MLHDLKLSNMVHVESLFKGPAGNRSLSGVCIVEFQSRSIREDVLSKLQDSKSDSKKNLEIARAKTSSQLERNSALRKAEEILKKEAPTKKIEIIWKKPDSKDKTREVNVDGIPAFRQNISDSSGCFLSPFVSLSI